MNLPPLRPAFHAAKPAAKRGFVRTLDFLRPIIPPRGGTTDAKQAGAGDVQTVHVRD